MRAFSVLTLTLAPLPLVLVAACGNSEDEKQYDVGPSGCIVGYVPCGEVCVPDGSCTQPGTGGLSAGGGTPGTGATATSGGTLGTGATTSGGTPGTGGAGPTGGATPTGGAPPTGGAATGGVPVRTPACNDSSTTSGALPGQYQYQTLSANGGKSYMLTTNWWGAYNGQGISYNGLSFRITSNTPNDGNDTPAGYPTMYIGRYQGHGTNGSNLPRQVSAITEIPSSFHTNVTSSNVDYNAAYDVWFTASSATLSDGAVNPGGGGAYLMVWLYKPQNRRPIGGTSSAAREVPGVVGTWDVFRGTNGGIPVISYVSATHRSSLDFDLNAFIEDAVTNNLGVTNSQYLSVVFAGFEVWSGAQNAEVTKFCTIVR